MKVCLVPFCPKETTSLYIEDTKTNEALEYGLRLNHPVIDDLGDMTEIHTKKLRRRRKDLALPFSSEYRLSSYPGSPYLLFTTNIATGRTSVRVKDWGEARLE